MCFIVFYFCSRALFLSIEWNLIKLGGPDLGIATKTAGGSRVLWDQVVQGGVRRGESRGGRGRGVAGDG